MSRVAELKPRFRIGYRLLPAVILFVLAATVSFVYLLVIPTPRQASEQAIELTKNTNKNYDKAIDLIKWSGMRVWTKEDRAIYLGALASTYGNKGDAARAIKYYKELEKIKADGYLYMTIGAEAEKARDKNLAIDYYQKALDYFRKNEPKGNIVQNPTKYLEFVIAELRK